MNSYSAQCEIGVAMPQKRLYGDFRERPGRNRKLMANDNFFSLSIHSWTNLSTTSNNRPTRGFMVQYVSNSFPKGRR